MAIRTETITLDVSPSCCSFAKRQCVAARQGDAGMVLDVNVTQDAKPMDLAGLTATLLYNNPDLVQVSGTVDGSTASFTIPSAGFSGRGVHQAYVQLAKGGTVIASTEAFDFNIAKGADLSAQQAQGYVTQLDEALATAQQASQTAEAAATQATQAVDDANAALQTANTAVQNANTAADAANAAAENANAAAQTVRTNILTGTLGPATIASADDAHPGALMRDVQVLGQTRQNLWTNPSGTSNGVTIANNDDGSMKLSGTASQTSYFSKTGIVALSPSKSYVLSVSEEIEQGVTIRLIQYAGDEQLSISSITSGQVVVTTDERMTSVTASVVVAEGSTVSGTYHVMLNEGPTAEPWCPPGLASVSELGIVTAGKNLGVNLATELPFTASGVTFSDGGNSGIKIIGTNSTEAYMNLLDESSNICPPAGQNLTVSGSSKEVHVIVGFKERDGSTIAGISIASSDGNPKTGSVPENAASMIFYLKVLTGTHDTVVYPMVELGSEATSYEPPTVTTTTQDLEGHELRSLPDGTCDVLTWEADGTRSIEQVSAMQLLDDSIQWFQYETNQNAFTASADALIVPQNVGIGEFFCDKLPFVESVFNKPDIGICFTGTSYPKYVYVNAPGVTSLEEFKSWIAANPLTIIYGAEPQTVTLAPVPMVAQPSTTLNVWADADDGLSPEVDVVYERDLTLAYNDLASKVAALEVTQATN